MHWTDDLHAAARGYGVPHGSLERFVELFVRWNERINLSAARTHAEVTLQVVDCLALVPYLSMTTTLVDVGSGGGLPGVVLATVLPSLQVRSIEPVHKKSAFQSTAARELALTNLTIESRRLSPSLDTNFDAAVSRATFDLLEWLTLGAQLISPAGIVLGMEGRDQRTLPAGAERLPYAHGDRTRAIIRYRPPSL
jgi:16S rRNA (guanine527-N7)-methyltransferase